MTRWLIGWALIVGYCCGPQLMAQDELEVVPRIQVLGDGAMGLIDDLQVSGFGGSTSISVTNVNGVKTTKIRDGLQRMELVEDPASGVTCRFTKVYGPKDLDSLEDEQPELYMHLTAIPKTIGESEIEINVGVTSTYTAADMDELKAKHPEVFEQYKNYVGKSGHGRLDVRMPRPLRLRVGPEGGAIELFGGAMEDADTDDEPMDESIDGDDDGDSDDGDGGR